MTKQKNISLLKIKILLEPMGGVDYLIMDKELLLQKNKATFGKIRDDKVYLIDNAGVFKQVERAILKTPDEFLRAATEAYWAVKK